MDTNTHDFEITRGKLLRDVAVPLMFVQVAVVLIAVGIYAFIASKCPDSLKDHLDLLKSLRCSLSMAGSFGILVGVAAAVWSLSSTAYKVRITDTYLEVSTFWQTRRFRWSEIADVKRFFYKWREYLLIKTWDANPLVLSPPLKPMDQLESELKARAVDAVCAPERPTQRPLAERKRELFANELMRGLRQMAMTIILIIAGLGIYDGWQNLRDPLLEIPGWDQMPITTGKKVWINDFTVYNHGRDFRGLELEVTGNAFDKKLLTKPLVLLESHDVPMFMNPFCLRKQTRELFALSEAQRGIWTIDAKSTLVKHKDDFFIQALSLLPLQLFGTTLWDHDFSVTLFADVPKKGKGTVKIRMTPDGYPANSEESILDVNTSMQRGGGATPIASVGVPADFPVSAYPGSAIYLLSAWDVRLSTAAAEKDIIAFYKDELNRKGWRTVETHDRMGAKLSATKRKDTLTVQVMPNGEGAVIEILLNFP